VKTHWRQHWRHHLLAIRVMWRLREPAVRRSRDLSGTSVVGCRPVRCLATWRHRISIKSAAAAACSFASNRSARARLFYPASTTAKTSPFVIKKARTTTYGGVSEFLEQKESNLCENFVTILNIAFVLDKSKSGTEGQVYWFNGNVVAWVLTIVIIIWVFIDTCHNNHFNCDTYIGIGVDKAASVNTQKIHRLTKIHRLYTIYGTLFLILYWPIHSNSGFL